MAINFRRGWWSCIQQDYGCNDASCLIRQRARDQSTIGTPRPRNIQSTQRTHITRGETSRAMAVPNWSCSTDHCCLDRSPILCRCLRKYDTVHTYILTYSYAQYYGKLKVLGKIACCFKLFDAPFVIILYAPIATDLHMLNMAKFMQRIGELVAPTIVQAKV